MKIIFRTCDNFTPINGSRPEWCIKKDFKIKCFKSLIDSISDNQAEVYLIGDKLAEETINQYNKLYTDLVIINSQDKLGNPKSLNKAFELADSFNNEDDIIYFCEDDYLHSRNFYGNTRYFFNTVGKMIDDVFFHPTDYPDQYLNSKIKRSYIFKNDHFGWFREIDSTTFTFACKLKTYKKFKLLLKDCASRRLEGYNKTHPIFHPAGADDARFSEIFGYNNPNSKQIIFQQKALCFCPLPGLASHIHKGTESLNFDGEQLFNSIVIE